MQDLALGHAGAELVALLARYPALRQAARQNHYDAVIIRDRHAP